MKKAAIGAIVGGLILFIWQFLSWSMLNIHGSNMTYTPKQEKILNLLEREGLEEGSYFLPTVSKEASPEEYEQFFKDQVNKPWARIQYNKTFDNAMGMNMFRGLIINILSVFFLCYILVSNPKNNFKLSLTTSLLVGLIGYFTLTYIESIWFETNSLPTLLDTLVSWGAVGLWLGWFLNRGHKE